MDEFSCIADSCEDTCCGGWGIQVDKKTFKEYNKLKKKSKKDKDFFTNNIIKNNHSKNQFDFGVIRLDVNGNCAFLNNDRLCSIVLEYGADALCETCKKFPRQFSYYKSSNIQEVSLSSACPEATRKIIGNNKKISFNVSEENKFNLLSYVQNNDSSSLDLYAFEIRMTIIKILQSELYLLKEKIQLVGLLCNKLIKEKNIHFVPQLLIDFESVLQTKINIPRESLNSKFSFDLMQLIISTKRSTNIKFNSYIKDVSEIIGINEDEFNNMKIELKDIDDKVNDIYKFSLENYLVNYVYKNNFPMKNNDLVYNYYLFVIHFSLIKLMLMAQFKKNGGISKYTLVGVIYSVGRALEHDSKYFISIISEMKNQNLYSIQHAMLIN